MANLPTSHPGWPPGRQQEMPSLPRYPLLNPPAQWQSLRSYVEYSLGPDLDKISHGPNRWFLYSATASDSESTVSTAVGLTLLLGADMKAICPSGDLVSHLDSAIPDCVTLGKSPALSGLSVHLGSSQHLYI